MTRLTEHDVRDLAARLPELDTDLRRVSGFDLRTLAVRSCGLDPRGFRLDNVCVTAVPISSGQGFIPFFTRCVEIILQHIGCDAFPTEQPDVKGLQVAAAHGAEVVFVADDDRFIALNLRTGACADDDPCTANGYVTVLEAAAGGLNLRTVAVLGLGPVGRAATRRLDQLGARVLAVEPDLAQARSAANDYPLSIVSLREALEGTDYFFDATPAADLIDLSDVSAATVAAVPAVPSSFTAAAQVALGPRHIHEPLAIGVAVMAVEALSGLVSARA
jgi:pyrrolysine biosynthesis protein PylD